jgi:hypothetical protein
MVNVLVPINGYKVSRTLRISTISITTFIMMTLSITPLSTIEQHILDTNASYNNCLNLPQMSN